MIRIFLCAIAWLPALACSCQKKKTDEPASASPISVPVSGIAEASGIADSKTNKGALWVIEDSGNPPQLILLGHDGQIKKKLNIAGAANRDWEEVALAGGKLYIGDIGDNNRAYPTYQIYRMQEPVTGDVGVSSVETIRLRYPDGSHDAEAFIVDPQTEDIYIITKRDSAALIFKLASPYSLTDVNMAEPVGKLSFTGVVSAALSPDGNQVLVKTYDKIYRYKRGKNESLITTLRHAPDQVLYQREPQGEAVCFKLDGSGYFTLSEQFLGLAVNLYFYRN